MGSEKSIQETSKGSPEGKRQFRSDWCPEREQKRNFKKEGMPNRANAEEMSISKMITEMCLFLIAQGS